MVTEPEGGGDTTNRLISSIGIEQRGSDLAQAPQSNVLDRADTQKLLECEAQ